MSDIKSTKKQKRTSTMQKMTEQYNLVDVVVNPTAAMDIYKRLRQYEQTDVEPYEITRLRNRVKMLVALTNALRKELSNRAK